ncbi:MAG: NUDIX hydrolase [Candidatus Zixiibacteriota bacterium]|nr:MAG: NUDIX hydrolase [candidate division Zixibacteria bacterium]
MKPGQIRPIAICVFRNKGKLLVGEHFDPTKKETFYRPLGGAIVFGERGRDCVIREIREEMAAEIKDLTYLDTIENVFTYDGKPGHEIVLVYEGNLVDSRLYEAESIRCKENGDEFTAVWKSMKTFRVGEASLYPEGLLESLEKKTK